MTDRFHKIPQSTILHERERTIGGVAEPNSDASFAIAKALAVRMGNRRFMKKQGGPRPGRREASPVIEGTT